MGKAKSKSVTSIPNKNIYSRMSYLYQAANYLSQVKPVDRRPLSIGDEKRLADEKFDSLVPSLQGQPRYLINQLRGISKKSTVRLTPRVKRSACKRCDALLIPGETSFMKVENMSRNQGKPWADILLVQCKACSTVKRFPIGQARTAKADHKSSNDSNLSSQGASPLPHFNKNTSVVPMLN